MEYLDPSMSQNKKFRRKKEEMPIDEFNEYARKVSQSDYEITRCHPKICKLIKQINNSDLDTKDYPYIDKPKQVTNKNKANIKKKGASKLSDDEFDK